MKKHCDLAIIGGGIIGVLTAWYARQKYPDWDIVLFEQGTISSGATEYSASLDIPYGHTPLRYQLSTQSGELYQQLKTAFPELPVKELEFYGIVQQQQAAKILQQITAENAGISTDCIPTLLANHPSLILPPGTTVIAGASASQAILNEVATMVAARFEATAHSSIFRNTKIVAVKNTDEKFVLQTSDDNQFSASKIIQATGPWKDEISGPQFSLVENTRVKKIVAFHIYQQPKATDPLFYFFDDDAFLMPKYEAGYWLFSFKCDHWDVQPDSNTLSIDEADIQKAQSILTKYYPSFAPLCTTGRVFCDLYSHDGDPVIEPASNFSNYIFAGAGAGSGYRLGPAIAWQAVELLST